MVWSSGYESSSGFSVRSYKGVDILQMFGECSVVVDLRVKYTWVKTIWGRSYLDGL
jgi:hypothetical protein